MVGNGSDFYQTGNAKELKAKLNQYRSGLIHVINSEELNIYNKEETIANLINS